VAREPHRSGAEDHRGSRTGRDRSLLQIDRFCTQFDGLHWTIARGNRLQVLDTQHSLREIVWQVTDLSGPISALANSLHQEHLLVETADGSDEHWIYQLPQRRLLSRDQLPPLADGQMRLLNTSRGTIDVALDRNPQGEVQVRARWNRSGSPFEYHLPGTMTSEHMVWTDNDWLVIGSMTQSGYFANWLLPATGRAHVNVRWTGASQPTVRAHGQEWLLFDTSGRLLSFNVEDGLHQKLTVR
jgi:hypothetical protein